MRLLAIAALGLLLTGCVAADPVVTPVPKPTTTPPFATDADALKAAEDAYAAYLAVSDQILRDGGTNPDRIDGYAVRAALTHSNSDAATARAKGERITGNSRATDITLEQYNPYAPSQRSIVVIYACLDVSGVDLLNAEGTSIVQPTRPSLQPLEVSFDGTGDGSSKLLVASEDSWTGKSFCS